MILENFVLILLSSMTFYCTALAQKLEVNLNISRSMDNYRKYLSLVDLKVPVLFDDVLSFFI